MSKQRKFVKMTSIDTKRLLNAQKGAMYIVDAKRETDSWNFLVENDNTEKTYSVIVRSCESQLDWSCECMDFVMRKCICKHALLLYSRVAGYTKRPIPDYTDFDKRLVEKIQSDKANVTEKRNDDCHVCFQAIEENPKVCETCNNAIHDECWKRWKKFNNSCPICRAKYTTVDDILERMERCDLGA